MDENPYQYPNSDNIHTGWDGKRVKVDEDGFADHSTNTTDTAVIYPDEAGVVIQVGDHKDYGLHVRVQGEDGIITIYSHLSKLAPELKEGNTVGRTIAIGVGGNTGNSSGSHIHIERYAQSPYPHPDGRVSAGEWRYSFVITDYGDSGYRISFPSGPSWYMTIGKKR